MKIRKNTPQRLNPNSNITRIIDKLPKMCFVDNGIVRTNNNILFGTLKVQGVNVDTASSDQINKFDNLLHNLISSLDDNFGVIGHVIRSKMPQTFSIKSNSKFTHNFNTKYKKQFEDAKLYQNDIYLTIYNKELTHTIKSHKEGFVKHFFNRVFKSFFSLIKKSVYGKEHKKAITQQLEKATKDLKEVLNKFHNYLGDIKVKESSSAIKFYASRLDEKVGEYSEMMTFLARFFNGLENKQFATPTEDPLEYHALGDDKAFKAFPYGNICEYLVNQRIDFGNKKYFGFADSGKIANMISVKKYSSGQNPLSFHNLFKVDAEMIYTVSFLPSERAKARKKMEATATDAQVSGDAGETELVRLSELYDDVLSETVRLGENTISVMVLADTKEELINKTNEVQAIFGANDFHTFVEDMNHDGAFFGQFPANFMYQVRARTITSRAFCHLFSMQNFPTGHTNRTHLGESICLVKTISKTPMHFNCHRKGSGKKNDFTAGHGEIIGSNGSGKTSWALMLSSLMEKYDTRLFFFDRNNGAEIYIEATNGRYINYSFDNQNDIKHNPFSMPNTPGNKSFIVRLLCSMVRREGEVEVSSKISRQLKECVEYAYNHIPDDQRCLSTAVNVSLATDFERIDELHEFMRGDSIRSDGKYASFFDNLVEGFDFTKFSKFGLDTTKLLKEKKLTGIITYYVFHLIMQVLEEGDNRPTLIFLDEGWSYLEDPYFSKELSDSFATLRKLNAFIILATQDAQTVLECSISSKISSNIAFKILYPNPDAEWEIYKKLKVSEYEFNWIQNTPVETRQALYIQGTEKAIIDLTLEDFDEELSVISGNSNTIALKRKIQKELGTKDPDVWLPVFYKELGFKND